MASRFLCFVRLSLSFLIVLVGFAAFSPSVRSESPPDCSTLEGLTFGPERDATVVDLALECQRRGNSYAHVYLQGLVLADLAEVDPSLRQRLARQTAGNNAASHLKVAYFHALERRENKIFLEKLATAALSGSPYAAYHVSHLTLASDEPWAIMMEDYTASLSNAHNRAVGIARRILSSGCTELRITHLRMRTYFFKVPDLAHVLSVGKSMNCAGIAEIEEKLDIDIDAVSSFFFSIINDWAGENLLSAKREKIFEMDEVDRWLARHIELSSVSPTTFCRDTLTDPAEISLCFQFSFYDDFMCNAILSGGAQDAKTLQDWVLLNNDVKEDNKKKIFQLYKSWEYRGCRKIYYEIHRGFSKADYIIPGQVSGGR